MLLEKLLKGFNYSTSTFNLKESKLFDQYFERILISKGTFLVKEGEIERYSYFVFDGILRCWLLNHKGEEQIFWFCKEGTFSMSNISFTLQTKSAFNVQTIVDSVIYRGTGQCTPLQLVRQHVRLWPGAHSGTDSGSHQHQNRTIFLCRNGSRPLRIFSRTGGRQHSRRNIPGLTGANASNRQYLCKNCLTGK